MFRLKTAAAFDSAHFLAGYEGKCANIHGHRWMIEVTVTGELKTEGPKRGMVVDFGDLKKAVKALADSYDHTLIFEEGTLTEASLAALGEQGFSLTPVSFRPTAENLARHFFGLLCDEGFGVSSVAVYETPENCAVYEAGS